jgi:hypothetical protein
MRHLITFSLLCLAGCSAAGDELQAVGMVLEPIAVPDTAPSAIPCQETLLTPDAEIFAAAQAAAARWQQAHGCPVSIGEGGIPVHAWGFVFWAQDEQVIHPSDPQLQFKQLCGATRRQLNGENTEIFISTKQVGCDPESIIMHETAHLWGKPGTHADDGICAPGKSPESTPFITEASLSWVCEGLQCQTFNPER